MKREIFYIHHECLPSTQDWARTRIEEFDLSKITVISADEQTQGRGTKGRSWISPKGCGIYATFVFKAPDLPFLMAQRMALTINRLFPTRFRFPNDLYIGDKKAGGILAYVHENAMLLGLGLNLSFTEEMLAKIDQPAISLDIEDPRQALREIAESFA
ncbi:MAG: biotin--[acetyl-CoA-carboxylase] ligase [Simkaniaceae bacterium]|nr:biotin--[acetyl-CoA-carboxylase] ligase [Simkaniaceae bacterium]